jgi:hypothetical protein
MKKKIVLVLILLMSGALFLFAALPVDASPQSPQAYYYTPTPHDDGRIIYIVKENDTCNSIALLNNITLEQLRQNNNLTGTDCLIIPGDELLIAVVTQAPTPTITSTPVGPTPTPFYGYGTVCVKLFNDLNGNGKVDGTEGAIAGGQISVADVTGAVSETGTTEATLDANGDWTPTCFENIPEGDYNISMAIPEGYNATTAMNYPLKLVAGKTDYVNFGAQPGTRLQPSQTVASRSLWLGLFGGLLILAGLGMGLYFIRIRR